MTRLITYAVTTIMILTVFTPAGSEDEKFRLSVLGALGVSSAHGDYFDVIDPATDFSFNPGLRLRINGVAGPSGILHIDLGFWETSFSGTVIPTDSYIYNYYQYLNLNAALGIKAKPLYCTGGLYFGKGLNGNSYREYTDEWVGLTANSNLGLIAEAGLDAASFISLGAQFRYGLKSIGSSVDIRTWNALAVICLHFLHL